MRAGTLRHIVTIEAPTTGTDVNGFPSVTWTAFATGVRAGISQMRAYDKAAIAATCSGADYTISLRYIPGVTGNMRVNHNGTFYAILGQPNNVDGRNREIVLICQSGVQA